MTKGIIVSPANRGVQVVVTDENNVQLLIDSNRGVNLSVVPQPRIEVLVDKGVEGAQGPVGPQGPQGTAATVTAGTTTTGAAGTSAIVTNSGTSSAAVFDFTIPQGIKGDTGAGVAVGGTTGQVLVKASNVNYDTTWATITGTLVYQGSWNASTNTPTLTSSVGTNGYYYVVGTSGSTNLNGITDWVVGDWAIFNGTIWQKIDNTDLVSSVNGQTGVVVLTASSVGALAIANNLSDLANASTARTNLNLGTAATQNSTAFATAAQGATADTALQTVTSADGSIVVLQTGTNIDLAVSAASPASTLLTQVRNTTGATLTKGTVVYISGATGQISTVSKAIASSDATSAQTLGMITANLANNSNGYVTVFGLLLNMDTSAYTDGAQLYLSGTVAGAVTATKPSAPIHLVYVAVVEYAHPTQGKLLVKVQNGYELAEIHDVSIVSPTTGQTLVYDSVTDLWSNSNAPTITGGAIDNTTVGATTPSTGVFTTLTATGQTSLGGAAGSEGLRVLNTASSTRYVQIEGSVAGQPRIQATGATTSLALSGNGAQGLSFWSNSFATEQMRVAHTASAVNYVQVTGAATGASPVISVQGSDGNPSLGFTAKGTGSLIFFTNSSAQRQFRVSHTASAVNYLDATGSAAGSAPVLSVVGSDTNIDLNLTPKGTGNVRFGTYTGTALSIAGYIEIKDSGGTVRKLAVVA